MSLLTQAVAPWLSGTARSYWGGIWSGEKLLSAFLSSNGTSTTTPEVNAITALNLSAVWCAVLMIAGSVATMPLFFYKRTDGPGGRSRERYTDDPRYSLLHDQPNPQTSKPVFWESFMAHVLLWGNGYAEIVRDQAGRPRELWLIHPSQCRPVRSSETGELRYSAPGKDGQTVYLRPEQIVHVPHISMDGLCGISVIGAARLSLGLTMQAENFGDSFYRGGSTQRYIARYPNSLTPEAHARLTQTLNTAFAKNDPVVVLEEGTDVTTISIPQKDAEYLSTREFQIQEIARWFNIPPPKLKDLDRATWNNIEQLAIEYVQDTLEPYLSKIEAELGRKLVLPLERRIQFVEFERDGRLAGDTAARTAALEVRRRQGIISINEWRALEGMPPIADGNVHLVPVNETDLARLTEIIDAQIKAKETPPPAPEPEPEPDEPEEDDDAVDAEQERSTLVRAIITDLIPEIQRALPPPPAVVEPAAIEAPPDLEAAAVRAASHRRIAADLARRMLAREADKARNVVKAPDKLRAWVGGPFYDRFEGQYRESLVPICGLTAPTAAAAAEMAARLADAYVAESRRQWHALLDLAPEDVPSAVAALLDHWEIERINTIPDAILREELAHG